MYIVNNSPENWLERACLGDKVWLVKENKEAIVKSGFVKSEECCGTIKIIVDGETFSWYVRKNGKGFDESVIILPIVMSRYDILCDQNMDDEIINSSLLFQDKEGTVVVNNPIGGWMRMIDVGHKVWLVKENKEAVVYSRFEWPVSEYFVPGQPLHTISGRTRYISYLYGSIGLTIDNNNVVWYVRADGKGIDGSSLILLPIYKNINPNYYIIYGINKREEI